jgi:aspartyl-tRNA(Asn)/glutamyl-tRNA(Gln) amidotransferase subunit A
VSDLVQKSARELVAGFGSRAFSPVEVIDALAARIDAIEPDLKAFVTLTLDEARAQAREAEVAYSRGEARPLEGVLFGVKDMYDTAGTRTTYGSAIFAEHVPREDAGAVRLLKEAGAIVVGKTATHEFAWGITTHNPHFDSGRNPWAAEYVCGGSSGGSAAALAALEVPLALGSDSGGSIRVPAAFCGVVGFKPTFGLVSTDGLMPLSPSLDHAGPLARTPADCALALSILAPGSLATQCCKGLQGVRIGVPRELPVALTPAIDAAYRAALDALSDLGADRVEVELPSAAEILDVYLVLNQIEALAVHRARGLWPARRDEYGEELPPRCEAAEARTVEDWVAASAGREHIRAVFVRAFGAVDVIVTPVSAASPVRLGENEAEHLGSRAPFRELVIPFTGVHNLIGAPACTIRAGFDELGLPVGVQLAGMPGADVVVLGAAQTLFEATADVQGLWPQV